MKPISRSLVLFLAASLAAACASHPPPLSEDGIVVAARKHVSDVPWTTTATYDVRRGAGRVLSAWLVVVSCTTCASEDSPKIIVLGLDRKGNVQSRAQQ
jgi:hypothetical protein